MPTEAGCVRTAIRLITILMTVCGVVHYTLTLLYGFNFWEGGCIYLCKEQDPLTETTESLLKMLEMDIVGLVCLPSP